jgi:hypothetical protein
MKVHPNYPYTDQELTARQVTPAKRSMSLAKAASDAATILLCIQQLWSQWENYGKLYVLRLPATGVEVPAIGSALRLRNRQSGIDLGVWRVLGIESSDPAYGTPFPVWDLHATTDHRAERRQGNGNTPQAQPATAAPAAPAPTITVGTANRASTRERSSHFPPAVQPATAPPAVQPAAAAAPPARTPARRAASK